MKVSIVGDVMVGGVLSSDMEQYKNIFLSNEVRKYLEADITFCNLECPLTMAAPPLMQDKNLLHAEKSSIKLLKNAGFNVVSLANNHIMDYRFDSVLETMRLLEENNIKYTGAGQNIHEARKTVYFNNKEEGGIAFLAYAAPETWGGYAQRQNQTHTAWIAGEDKPGVAPLDLKLIQEDIRKARQKADFLIVSVHWGEEYAYFPHPMIIFDAHEIVDMGADLVVGHHPHILQGYEQYHGGLIVYSLSNFLFSPYYDLNQHILKKWSYKSRKSVILRCDVLKNKILSYEFVPVIQKKDDPIMIYPSHKTIKEILLKIEDISKEYKKDDYRMNYAKLRRRESRFRNLKLLSESLETYGLATTTWLVGNKLFKMLKNM
jgi:poly-gamma-glutamate synthesis protein (capsule biosynthesis protein)